MNQFCLSLAKKIILPAVFVLILAVFYPQLAAAASIPVSLNMNNSTPRLLAISPVALQEDGVVPVVVPRVEPDKTLAAVITAYSSTPGQTDDDPFTAASGKRVYDGMVANNCLPFGTKLRFPDLYGNKIFTVDDRMNSRYGCHRFDIWLDAPLVKVNAFGVKRVGVEIFYTSKVSELARAR